MKKSKPIEPVKEFKNTASFEKWLRTYSQKNEAIWLRFFKKDSGKVTFTYQDALEVALCYGWIDGQKKSFDAQSWIQRFTPRRKNSNWSKRNTAIVEKLIATKRMKPEGQRLVDEAKTNGRWESAYAGQRDIKPPADFLARLKRFKAAFKQFELLKKSDRFSILLNIDTAKTPETRERRIEAAIKKLTHPERE